MGKTKECEIIRCNYEELTENQTTTTKALVKSIGLKWDDAFLRPHENSRSVRTASQQQVRKKVYSGSSQAWKKYRDFLPASIDTLTSL